MFHDLKNAIRNVLFSARGNRRENGKPRQISHTQVEVVDKHEMKTLQAEYNIYFVEPDDEQMEAL